MHRFPTSSAIRRVRLTSLLLSAKCVFTPLAAVLLIYALCVSDLRMILIALGLIILTLVLVFFQWLLGSRTHCPLCMTPVLATKRCAKHRQARSFLGSYRLRVALAVLFTNSFRCPYCNEPAVLRVRDRSGSR